MPQANLRAEYALSVLRAYAERFPVSNPCCFCSRCEAPILAMALGWALGMNPEGAAFEEAFDHIQGAINAPR